MNDETKKPEPSNTLRDDEIESSPKVDRRGILATIGLGAVAAMAAGIASLLPGEADAAAGPAGEGHEGNAPGPVGAEDGRQTIAQSCTDRDAGRYADPAGRGRRCYRPPPRYYRRRCTDSDGGRFADPPGRGRRC